MLARMMHLDTRCDRITRPARRPGSPDRLDALVSALDELFASVTTNPWERLVRLGKTVGGVA